mmetsp:Transcript_22342/g.52925  ORF Transcript_22342/g.52925 Transcript_22342/m.52925 type:complete len:130 (-) Transcript_22342:291-680(-)
MAVFADFWSSKETDGAFANLKLHSGLTSALAFYFLNDVGSVQRIGLLCLLVVLLGLGCYLLAHVLTRRGRSSWSTHRNIEAEMVSIVSVGNDLEDVETPHDTEATEFHDSEATELLSVPVQGAVRPSSS